MVRLMPMVSAMAASDRPACRSWPISMASGMSSSSRASSFSRTTLSQMMDSMDGDGSSISDKAYNLFLERAEQCNPPLPESELDSIWKSALKFAKKVQEDPDYIAPEEYNNDFGTDSLMPEDYSDIGQARVLAATCAKDLRYTSATGFLAFGGDRWHEDGAKALGIVEAFLDAQLADAEAAITAAEEALMALGIDKSIVKGRGKDLARAVPSNKIGLLYALHGAVTYQKFVMKYRNYKNIVNAMNACKPMVAIDVSELDYDPELLNTPDGTYDLAKGLAGWVPHDPDDLITKITGCGPGDKGMDLWLDALDLFFCKDRELIEYVQREVGLAAIGKVHEEALIIAHGGGANGKSTFWNAIARTLGTYSGKISAEVLIMNCKRNVKPEMAELKGKRLIADDFHIKKPRVVREAICSSSESQMTCRMPCALQNALASFSSLSGKEQERAVTAMALSPSASWAAKRRNVESTPPEKATATLPIPCRYFFSSSYFHSCSAVGSASVRSMFYTSVFSMPSYPSRKWCFTPSFL